MLTLDASNIVNETKVLHGQKGMFGTKSTDTEVLFMAYVNKFIGLGTIMQRVNYDNTENLVATLEWRS